MKRITIVALTIFILMCIVILVVDSKSDQGILNKIGKKEMEDTKAIKEKPEIIDKTKKEESKLLKPSEPKEVPKEKSKDKLAEPVVIVIDPGHQENGNYEEEPIGPDATETKPKVAGGTTGVATKKPEHELTLEASLLLEKELKEKGYDVILTRTSAEVDISNIERSQVANENEADLFLRIHADGAESSEVSGFSVLTPGEGNDYTENIYQDSLLASENIITNVGKKIPLFQNGLFFRDDLSGFNWSEVPVVLIELGFMTNSEEDKKLSDEKYLLELTDLISDGVEDYIEEKK